MPRELSASRSTRSVMPCLAHIGASASAIAQHQYAATLSYQVTLTVTDTLGRTGTITQTVAVP